MHLASITYIFEIINLLRLYFIRFSRRNTEKVLVCMFNDIMKRNFMNLPERILYFH